MPKQQSSKIKTALKISFEYWAIGVVLFNLLLFSRITISEIVILALVLNPFPVLFFSHRYLKEINSKNKKDGLIFGIFLAATQIFADTAYILLFFKENLMVFNIYFVALVYAEMIIFSAI